jgi:hypothetical protein
MTPVEAQPPKPLESVYDELARILIELAERSDTEREQRVG